MLNIIYPLLQIILKLLTFFIQLFNLPDNYFFNINVIMLDIENKAWIFL